MNQNLLTTLMRGLALVLAGGFMLLACGSDDSSDGDTSSNADGAVEEADSSSDETESADEAADTSSDDSDDDADADASEDVSGGGNLLVPLDYLQGVWCDHEGTTWTIDGEMVTLDDGSGGTGQGDTVPDRTDGGAARNYAALGVGWPRFRRPHGGCARARRAEVYKCRSAARQT